MSDLGTKGFRQPRRSLGQIDTDAAARLAAVAADVSLIIDRKGTIVDVAFGTAAFTVEGWEDWIGKRWIDTVTSESQPKVEAILAEATEEKPSRWRQVNYPGHEDNDVPVLYSAIKIGNKGRLVALGRELRSMAQLQQRLITAQQSIEREYARLRQLETRYKLLFQIANEGVVICDAGSLRIIEANPRAEEMLARGNRPLVGTSFTRAFTSDGEAALRGMFAAVRARGEIDETAVQIKESGETVTVTASLLRQGDATLFLLRLMPATPASLSQEVGLSDIALLGLVERLPDGFVVTNTDGLILDANTSFIEMARAASEEHIKGRYLEEFLGRQGVDLSVLLSNLREHGQLRHFETTLRSIVGTLEDVDVSAAMVADNGQSAFGFTIRPIRSRPVQASRPDVPLARSVDEMTKLVGRIPLRDLVRETTDMIERLCIEAALKLTQDNRALAAEMLGLSRQSLYTKLRRYGIADLDTEETES